VGPTVSLGVAKRREEKRREEKRREENRSLVPNGIEPAFQPVASRYTD
jgi:hypothetical protein